MTTPGCLAKVTQGLFVVTGDLKLYDLILNMQLKNVTSLEIDLEPHKQSTLTSPPTAQANVRLEQLKAFSGILGV